MKTETALTLSVLVLASCVASVAYGLWRVVRVIEELDKALHEASQTMSE